MEATLETFVTSRNESVLDEIVTTVAEREQCDPTDLPPLYDAIDPDALNTVVDGRSVTDVSFEYHGYTVHVNSDGRVDVATA